MARRKNYLSIDFNAFSDYAERLDELNADLKAVFTDAMEQAGETIQDDVIEAVGKAYLPAQGQYSRDDTEKSIIKNAKVKWSGNIGELGVGFDKSKPGAGGWLITGTPKMRPDYKLEDIFGRRKYERDIIKQISETLQDAIDDHMGGG